MRGGGHYGPIGSSSAPNCPPATNSHNANRGGGGISPPRSSLSRSGGGGGGRSGGAAHLARIHGTEEDKVNCPFYFKIGACRHADRCSRLHHRPAFSPTILIKHIYCHPVREAELRASIATDKEEKKRLEVVDARKAQEDFLFFFENMYEELGKFGRLEALHVCDNLGDHMIGHVYAKFSDEEEAADALQIMNGRYYDGRKMEVEFSPVTDFREARCRDFDEDTCSRGGFCNFMHIKPVPHVLIRSLEDDCEDERRREHRERERRLSERRRRDRERRSRRTERRERRSGSSRGDHHRHRRGGDESPEDGGSVGSATATNNAKITDDRLSRSRSRSRSRNRPSRRSRSPETGRSRRGGGRGEMEGAGLAAGGGGGGGRSYSPRSRHRSRSVSRSPPRDRK